MREGRIAPFFVAVIILSCTGRVGEGVPSQAVERIPAEGEFVEDVTQDVARDVVASVGRIVMIVDDARDISALRKAEEGLITGRITELQDVQGIITTRSPLKPRQLQRCECKGRVCIVHEEVYVEYVTSKIRRFRIDTESGDTLSAEIFVSDRGVTGVVSAGKCNFSTCELFSAERNCTLTPVGTVKDNLMCISQGDFGLVVERGERGVSLTVTWQDTATRVVCSGMMMEGISCDFYSGTCNAFECSAEPVVSCEFMNVGTCAGMLDCLDKFGRFTPAFTGGVRGAVCEAEGKLVVERDGEIREVEREGNRVVIRYCKGGQLDIQKCAVQTCAEEMTRTFEVSEFSSDVTRTRMAMRVEDAEYTFWLTSTVFPHKTVFSGTVSSPVISFGFRGERMGEDAVILIEGDEVSGQIQVQDGKIFGQMRARGTEVVIRTERDYVSVCRWEGDKAICSRFSAF